MKGSQLRTLRAVHLTAEDDRNRLLVDARMYTNRVLTMSELEAFKSKLATAMHDAARALGFEPLEIKFSPTRKSQ